jgi:hypothetical protein
MKNVNFDWARGVVHLAFNTAALRTGTRQA